MRLSKDGLLIFFLFFIFYLCGVVTVVTGKYDDSMVKMVVTLIYFFVGFILLLILKGYVEDKSRNEIFCLCIFVYSVLIAMLVIRLIDPLVYIFILIVPFIIGGLFVSYSYDNKIICGLKKTYDIFKDYLLGSYSECNLYFVNKNWVINYFVCSYFYFFAISIYFYQLYSDNENIYYLPNNMINLIYVSWMCFIVIRYFHLLSKDYAGKIVVFIIIFLFPFGLFFVFDLFTRYGDLISNNSLMFIYKLMVYISLSTLFISATLVSEVSLEKIRYKFNL